MRWNPFKFTRRPARRRPITRGALAVQALEARLAPAVDVLTYHNNAQSTGVNAAETALSPANVKVGSFGKQYVTPVDGQIYAQPLVVTGVGAAGGASPGSTARDVVYVATENDSLYAIDADDPGLAGTVLWKRSFTDLSIPGNNTLGATAITSVPNGDTGTGDINPVVGITGTPVIDKAANTLYLVAKTKETINGAVYYVQRLHAINLTDGSDRVAPYVIGYTTNGNTNTTAIYVYGSGDGAVTDPYNGTGKPVVQFNALREAQRAALSLVNGSVYVEWASHGDNGPYHGWVAKWDVSALTTTGFKLTGVLNTSPNNGLSGIWGGGGQLTFETDGSAFYFETGNGSGGAPTLNANGFPVNGNYNEALVKVTADATTTPTSQNENGWGMKVVDYFTPFNVTALDGADSDFGSGAPLILPDSAGIPGHPHLLVAAGKEGKIYLVDRDNLGKFDPVNDHVLNAVPNGSGNNTPPVQLGGSLSTAAYYNGTLYWASGYSSYAYAYGINPNGTLSVKSQTAVNNFGYLPGSPSVSANGTTGGIVWVMDRNANLIRAYDAATLATELWDSGQKAGGGDNLGAVVKFAVPTVADGQVYVGTTNSLVAYGLNAPPTAVPGAPTNLTATALSGSAIQLAWQDATLPPNMATGYTVEESTDGTTFTPVTTAPAGATQISIGGLALSTKYWFRIRGFNGVGNSAYSNVASATTTNQVAVLDFSGGFVGSTNKLTYNGSATINGSAAELTQTANFQAGSVFSTSPVDVTKFSTEFTFQLTAGGSTADGFTFAIQGVGPTALGAAGGDLGYAGIGKSVAVKFDLYNNAGEGSDSTGLYTNGVDPFNVGSVDLSPTGVDLHSGDLFRVDAGYDGTALTVTITDTLTGQHATTVYTIDIPGTVGGSAAYVGFTGGTGGLVAAQDIRTWTYSPAAVASPNAPSGLGATPASATSVALNWTNNATTQTGFHLDRATDAGFTQNLITETLPGSPNAFTDTATGLAPGLTFYYRLRAFNSAGDSANSNSAVVTIPLAPPKPTNQQVTAVTTTEIDITWQDNAGHATDGYHILRAVNHGTFTQVASLPPTSRTPPSNYDWADTNLTPGTYYEYHIVAYNVSGYNDFAGVNATTLTLPPGTPAATAGPGQVVLTWTAPTGAVTYDVYRGTAAGGEAATPIATGLTAPTYTDAAVAPGTAYYYVITALNGNAAPLPAESAPSAEVSATPTAGTTASTTGLTAGPNPSVYGQAVTLTATVGPAGGGAGTPTGAVTFTDGATPLGTVTLTGGVAALTLTSLGAGAHQFRASYAGDATFAASGAGPVALTVAKDTTTTVLAASTPSPVYYQFVTFTATVTADLPGGGTPTGTVTFYDGATPLAGAALVNGVATYKTQALAVGGHAITARYNGSTNYVPSSVPALSEPVAPDAVTVAVISTAARPVFGQPVTFTATVAAAPPGAGVPTGMVTFTIDGTVVGPPVPLGTDGRARYTTAALTAGPHTVTVSYAGDAHFLAGTGTFTQTVARAATTAAVAAAPNPAVVGQPVTLTATVAVPAPGAGAPTGTVTFLDGTTVLGTVPLTGLTAALTTAGLGAGRHVITARYDGDPNFAPATSAALAETVAKAGTTTTLATDGSPTAFGQVVTLTAGVAVTAPGAAPLTGTVTFKDGAAVLGTAPLVGGVATLTTAGLKVGSHALTATYNGDAGTAVSTAAGVTQVVGQAGTTVTLSSSLSPAYYSQAVTFTAAVGVAAPGAGAPTGTVQFYVDGVAYGSPRSVVGGAATLVLNRLAAGDHTVTATYSGAASFQASTAAGLTETILPARADLAVAMTADRTAVAVGGLVTYTVTVTNAGPSLTGGFVLTDAIPAGAAFVSAAASVGTIGLSGGALIGHLGLAAGGSVTYTVVLRATTAGTLTNAAAVSAAEFDPDLSNNTASWTVTVGP